MNQGYRMTEEVRAAAPEGRAVALESSIICQGMPWPQNLETAVAMGEAIRAAGAVPALTAVVDGVVRVGLEGAELEELAQRRDTVKVGMRDLPWTELKGLTGGTTVSGTMAIAAVSGIRVFATGGIGGVHRGAFAGAQGGGVADVSSDLTALSKFDVLVVCSGAKSFLDLENTLEMLETLGVPVIGFGTDDFPGFYVRQTGFKVPYRLDEAGEVAAFARAKWGRGLDGGILVTNPVPEAEAADEQVIGEAIERARAAAVAAGVKGKAVTPFILERIRQLTEGLSLAANVALAVNNARVAGRIAAALGPVEHKD
jgi:pseudouridine-5'-phosphate glycosidase